MIDNYLPIRSYHYFYNYKILILDFNNYCYFDNFNNYCYFYKSCLGDFDCLLLETFY